VTDGGFRPDGTFVPLPLHDVATLTEAFRRAVLRWFVRRGLLDGEAAPGMLAWPHSGFHVHDGVWVPAEERAFATRLARYCARHPVALGRLAYRADSGTVTYQSDQPSGPTAGAEPVGPAIRAPAPPRPPASASLPPRWAVHSANRTLGGPIEIPIPYSGTRFHRRHFGPLHSPCLLHIAHLPGRRHAGVTVATHGPGSHTLPACPPSAPSPTSPTNNSWP